MPTSKSHLCPHGQLARSCEICERDKQIAFGVTERGLLEDLIMEKNKRIASLEEERDCSRQAQRDAENLHSREIARIAMAHGEEMLSLRMLFQNERDNFQAAQEEIHRLTINQQLQDSATAAVMERAEKAESKLSHQKGTIVMAGLKVAELEAECAALRVDAERLNWLEANPRIGEMHIDGKVTDCYFYAVAGAPMVKLRDIIDAAKGKA